MFSTLIGMQWSNVYSITVVLLNLSWYPPSSRSTSVAYSRAIAISWRCFTEYDLQTRILLLLWRLYPLRHSTGWQTRCTTRDTQYIVGYADERLNILRLGTVDTYFETMRVSGRWSNSRYQSTTSKLTSFPSLPGAFPVWHYLSRCFPISM